VPACWTQEDSDYNSTLSNSTTGCANILQYLPAAIEQTLISESALDTSLSRALTVRMQLGEFDDESTNPWKRLVWQKLVESREHQALAREASHKSLVLLRNNNKALPLSDIDLNSRKVAVVGPWATGFVNCSAKLVDTARRGCDRGALYFGDYSPGRYEYAQANPWPNVTARSNYTTTIAEGIGKILGKHTELVVEQGCESHKGACNKSSFNHYGCVCESNLNLKAVSSAVKGAEIVVVALGTGALTEAEGQDRESLVLPGHQEDILAAALAAAKGTSTKVILLLFNAGGVVVPDSGADAIIAAGFPGQSAGLGIADVLSGRKSIAGRLAVTWPRALSQVAPIADYRLFGMHNSTYRYSQPDPLYAFGWGLSFSTIAYSKPQLKKATIGPCGMAELSVTVTNTGPHMTDEVILAFAEWARAPNPTQDRQLVAFHRVNQLSVGSSATINLRIEARDLATLQVPGMGGRKSSWMSGSALVNLFVGPNQPPDGAQPTLTLNISGPTRELSGCPKGM
jgi:beta-glucosidase